MVDAEPKTLLLVEDDAIIGLSESLTLKKEGYEVIHVFSGEAAVSAMAEEACRIELVLMDINLGAGMDGTEAAQLILAGRDIPLVFLSSHTEKEIVEKTEGITNYGYIVKNSGPTVLFTSIKMAFRLYEARKGLERSLAEQRRVEAALEERVLALTSPVEDGEAGLRFDDLFNREEIQAMQDAFADATGVASIITDAGGSPITRPSRFCRLCRDFVRSSPAGMARCWESDRILGTLKPHERIMQPCLSAGLWDGGTSITVGDRVVAKWLIGQVLDDRADLDELARYATEIGVDPAEYRKALDEVPRMSAERFEGVCQSLTLFAQQLSKLAYQNVQQARYIAERKVAEDYLRASEANLRRAESAAGIGSWQFDMRRGRMEASEGAVKLYGIPSGEDLIANVQRVPLPQYRPLLDAALKGLVSEGKPYDVEFSILRPADGAIVDIHSFAEYDAASGKVFGIIRDVTELRKETRKLRESEAHFREIFENAAIALLEEDFSGAKRRIDALRGRGVVDLDMWLRDHPEDLREMIGDVKILHVNRAYRRLFDFDDGLDLAGADIGVLPTVDLDRLRKEFTAFASGTPIYSEDMGLAKRGHAEVALKLLIVIPAEHAEDWSRVFVSFIDITNEKLAERRLEGLVRDKETLMKELEHRVKNSMTLISSLFSLESERIPDEATRQVFEEAQERVRTVSSIYDLLSHSTDTESLDSKTQLEELVRLFTDTYLGSGGGLVIETRVQSVPIAIRQAASISLIINELLTNALKYACPPGREGHIVLEFSLSGGAFHIVVGDDGPGLPKDFDLEKSTHLGFKLVRLLASQYEGSLSLSSGKGLRAEVTIPA